MALSSHVAFVCNGKVQCARCRSSYNVRDKAAVHFLRAPCAAIGSNIDRPNPLTFELIHKGNYDTHHSHKHYNYRGVAYCNKCGNRAIAKMHKLRLPCTPPTVYGKQTLAAINNGQLPPNLRAWPDCT